MDTTLDKCKGMAGDGRQRCFAPVVDEHTRVLILGSLPGLQSLAKGEYYGNRQNAFWKLVGRAIEVDLVALDYAQRLQALLAHGIGLWDVIAEAQRQGSLDSAIRQEVPNPLLDLLATLPQLRCIAFNGGTAARHGRRQLQAVAQRYELLDLPSSSPAYTLGFEHKLLAWAPLGGWLAAT